jgi:hypothetical protein
MLRATRSCSFNAETTYVHALVTRPLPNAQANGEEGVNGLISITANTQFHYLNKNTAYVKDKQSQEGAPLSSPHNEHYYNRWKVVQEGVSRLYDGPAVT